MRILNNPVSAVTATDKTDLAAALDTLKTGGNSTPTFAQARQALPAGKRARFTDGMLHATALELGLQVQDGKS